MSKTKALCASLWSLFYIVLFTTVFTGCSEGDKINIIGKWIDDETEATFEYTKDGYYYEYTNENYTEVKTKYTLDDGKIIYYLDGSDPDTGYGVEYEITKEGNLIIGGEIVYRPLTIPEKDETK